MTIGSDRVEPLAVYPLCHACLS